MVNEQYYFVCSDCPCVHSVHWCCWKDTPIESIQ